MRMLYRSILLQEDFPIVSSAVRYLPEFVLEEACKNCTKVKKKKKGKKFKYRKQYVFSEGAHFAISCPEYVTVLLYIPSDLVTRLLMDCKKVIYKNYKFPIATMNLNLLFMNVRYYKRVFDNICYNEVLKCYFNKIRKIILQLIEL